MRRFDDGALLESFAARARCQRKSSSNSAKNRRFHDEAEIIRRAAGASDAPHRAAQREEPARLSTGAAGDIEAITRGWARWCKRTATARRAHARGKTRRCHGDLTLRNICVVDGAPTPFDCIEFSDELAAIDVLYDLAFLLMDLHRVGKAASPICAQRYLDWRDECDGLGCCPCSCRCARRSGAYRRAQNKPLRRAAISISRANWRGTARRAHRDAL